MIAINFTNISEVSNGPLPDELEIKINKNLEFDT